MSKVTQNVLFEVPHLAPWLLEREWHDEFSKPNRDISRLRLVHARVVDPPDHPPVDDIEADLAIGAEIQDSSGHRHHTKVMFFSDDGGSRFDFISDCSCEADWACPHAALVLESLASIVGKSTAPRIAVRDPAIEGWLNRLRIAEQQAAARRECVAQPASATRFLAYCIEPGKHGEPANLCLRVGSRTKRGDTSIAKSHATADPTNPAAYMAPDDMAICAAVHARRNRQRRWSSALPIEGSGWENLLETALATGRLFAIKPRETVRSTDKPVALAQGPPLPVEPGWKMEPDGAARPELSLPSPDLTVLLTQPLRYIDLENGLLGFLQSETPAEILAEWPRGPWIPAIRIPELNARLHAIPTPAPLPAPAEKPSKVLTGLSPAPMLEVTWVHVGIYQRRHIGGVVRFLYPGCPPLPPLAPDAPPQTSWIEDDTRLVLMRDRAREEELLRQLPQAGLPSITAFYPERELNDKNRHSVVLGDTKASVGDWLEFLSGERAAAMRAAGWTIEGDPRLGLVVHDIRDFFPSIETDPNHGIDWFRFDVTGEFGGKRVSLIPWIARAITEDWLDRYRDPATVPEHLIIPCDNLADGHIRFPARRFLDILGQVRHLFVGHGQGKELRLDRIAAAGVADALAIDASETTRALATLGKNLRQIDGLPPAPLPPSLRAGLRPYQIDGFRWLQFLAANGLHGILADDMGLGKTLQTLAHLAAEAATRPGKPSLVIAPTSVVPNWAAEAEKFAPTLKILTLHGGDRLDRFAEIPAADVVLTTYPLLVRDASTLVMQPWHVLVLDEAQVIKNPKSTTAHCACRLDARHRLCLSGTPMENHLGELWSLMRFLMPGFLGDEKSFNSHIRKPVERDRSGIAQAALNRRVSPLILRRTKDQVAAELPEKTILIHGIDLTAKQADLYESVRAAMDRRVQDAIAEKGLDKSHIIVLAALLKLRQICCHPQLLGEEAARRVTESAKLDFLARELLPTLIEEGRRILLFSQFTSMLELIEEHLELADIPFLKLTGQTRERAQLVRKFQSGKVPVFLISLKAGGTGLNLTAADTVIHYDPWWNPAAENQATDRAHRIGQKKPVFVHKLVCRGTIEERIIELQKHKAALVEALLSEETGRLRIDSETLSHLLAPVAAGTS